MDYKKLIIVESPHKAETIKGFISKDSFVVASKGHIKNLPSKEYGVSVENGVYKGEWKLSKQKIDMLNNIKSLAKKSEKIYIATDDDREGERIAWDIVEFLGLKEYYRIIFHEITEEAIKNAIENPILINENVVNSQIARRIIDRILGYPISEMIRWYFNENELAPKELIKHLGIGRVSAPALAILTKNEEKIEEFIPSTYKKVAIDYFVDGVQFRVKNPAKFTEDTEEELKMFRSLLLDRKNIHVIEKYKKKTEDKQPPPPLTTTWMQRGANYQLGFKPDYTMKIAQELYEGVNINGKRYGLITYIRTDSYNINKEKLQEASNIVLKTFGEEYVYNGFRKYKNKEWAQEAHEAIRPTYFTPEFFPKRLRQYLTDDQFKLYNYIFYRTIVLVMKASVYDKSEVVVNIAGNKFKAIANNMQFDGWEKIGSMWQKEDDDDFDDFTTILPSNLYVGQELKPLDVITYSIKEKTPPRYGVGRFLTTLEKNQIARPSTIATVVSGLENKNYVKIITNMIYPEALGRKVYYFLEENAPWLINIEHAKKFEDDLLLIEKGEKDKNELIEEYEKLKNELKEKIGYKTFDEQEPEEWLIEKAKKIASLKGDILDDNMLKSKKSLYYYVKKNEPEEIIIGKCPKCKSGKVTEKEKAFFCNDKDCDFALWKNNLIKFFEVHGKMVEEKNLVEYSKIIFKRKKCFISNFVSKEGKSYNGYISLEYNEKYKNWGFKLSFARKKEIDEKYIPSFERKEDKKEQKRELTEEEKLKLKIKKLEKEKRLAENKAKKDSLTRAFNKGAFLDDINDIFNDSKLLEDFAVAFIDGDHFKSVNDTYGHQAGDEILIMLVNEMFNITREKSANVYRYGGEEFIILFTKTERAEVLRTLEQLRKNIENKVVEHNNKKIQITISIGVAFYHEGHTKDSILKAADDAVYEAKEHGRNRIEFFA